MLGSIACRTSPSLEPIAARAREELLISIELFEKAADHLVIRFFPSSIRYLITSV